MYNIFIDRQRGSNENTNGLLREYSPKGVDLTDATDEEIQGWATKLNTRPKKCLNWKTPYEIFYKTVLHLIWQFKVYKNHIK